VNKFYILQQLMRFKGLPPSARVVGYEIVNHWNYKTKSCYPSQDYLSKKLHLSSPTVKRAIKLLEQCNIIKVERKMGMSNRYLINFVELTWIEPSKKMIPVSPVIPKSINIYNNINTSIKNEEKKEEKVDPADVKRLIGNVTKHTNSSYRAVVEGKQHRRNSLEAIAQRVKKRLTIDHFNSWYEAAYSKDKSTAFNALQYATKVLNV
tara:strand:+ start:130 stop:750 length:621 start_codon:yes stop_codon:yes gene_type:complete